MIYGLSIEGSFCLLFQVVVIVALIYTHLSVVDFKDTVDQIFKKVPVVADNNNGTFELLKCFQQDFTAAMSKWFVGSSSIRKLMGLANREANITRLFSPPDRIEIFFSTSSPEN